MVIEASPCALVRIRWGAADLTNPSLGCSKALTQGAALGAHPLPRGRRLQGGRQAELVPALLAPVALHNLVGLVAPLALLAGGCRRGFSGGGRARGLHRSRGGEGIRKCTASVIPAAPG